MSISAIVTHVRSFFVRAWNETIHLEEEIIMSLPQNVTDALAAIKAELASASTVPALQQQVTDLTAKAADLQSQLDAANKNLASTQTQLTDAQSQLTELLNAVLALAPAAAA